MYIFSLIRIWPKQRFYFQIRFTMQCVTSWLCIIKLCYIYWLFGHLNITQPVSLFLRDFTSYFICLMNPNMFIFTAITFVYIQPSWFPWINNVGVVRRERKYNGTNITVIYDSRGFECSHFRGTHMHSINYHIMQERMKLGILRKHSLAVQVNT